MPDLDRPRALCDVRTVVAEAAPTSAGALWRLAESGRQLDANLVRLPPREHIETHAEPDLDVLLIVVDGTGTMTAEKDVFPLGEGLLCWLPRGSTRSLMAGDQGLAYVTVHRRRPGLQIGRRPDVGDHQIVDQELGRSPSP
jgi:quercetin dioxygenase-like cupin family protein